MGRQDPGATVTAGNASTINDGAAVLLLWIPIRQMPGLGTVSNVIVLGLAAGAALLTLADVLGTGYHAAKMAGVRPGHRVTVIGDGAVIGARCELLRGARVWPGVEIPDGGIRYSTDM